MTHQYKSELIKEIVEARGHEKSSLHYESECVESWINEAKGAYPKLTDYESEWLNYMVENPIGEFPYETIIDVTDAVVDNVVPYAYKSAILKGDSQRVFNPTKNLFDGELEQGTIDSSTGNNGNLSSSIRSKNFVEIGVNTAFTLSRKKGTASLGFRCYDKNKKFLGTIFTAINAGTLKVTYTTDSNTVYIRFIDNTNDLTNKYQIEIGSTATDYEEPNYELKSVKMPVLTTTGKNLFDSEMEVGGLNSNNGGNDDGQKDRIRTKNYIKVKPNTFYILSRTNYKEIWSVRYYDENYNHISPHSYNTYATMEIKTGENVHYIRMVDLTNDLNNLYQLEEGKQVTSYEPHKSNILTVNEEVELRGIGEVRDELNLLTGEISNNFNKITIDGTENWYKTSNETELTVRYRCDNIGVSILNTNICICDSYNVGGNTLGDNLVVDFIGTMLTYRVLKSKFPTLEDFKKWLNDNPHTFIYQTEKSIKTVDLSVIDQDGNTLSQIKPLEGFMHISTDGKPLKPTVSMEIPVEAITQNLTSFIEEE